ncbi:sperm-associated antigen 1-like isoform X2 [Brienomyrus brachyistius]|uniref:sperm-associated antigen 1-like isoform X2 n=1 Tax=Brienomyrus brachyistius TaxID=42636 RepID=UPI0020B1FD68|nr:sperm-associated antigen 1-like isoform X2 [Brienomyrus brachyistius]
MSIETVSSLLTPSKVSVHGKVPVEHLDYVYIQNCSDLRYLETIVDVLRSGEEGMYPHLTEFCEKRIEKLNPKSRALRKRQAPATAADFSFEEWSQIAEELKSWETETKRAEAELREVSPSDSVENVPPVRGSNSLISQKQNSVPSRTGAKRKSALPRDYREWDKFDIEKECAKTDGNDKGKDFPVIINQCLPKINRKLDTAGLTEKERAVLASREREKGNEAFKANDYEEAVAYYTRSVSAMPTAAAYNNRAQAKIKLQLWHSALGDCERVLELEPGNVKALLRRATVQKQLGNLKVAADDLGNVLREEPENASAKEVEKKLRECTQESQSKGRKILIEEVEDEELWAKPGPCVSGESTAAPAERGDMGNAQKKTAGRAEGAPQGEADTHGTRRRGKRGSLDQCRTQEAQEKKLPNGAQASRSGTADQTGRHSSSADNAAASGTGSRLDAPCGALPPPLARLKNEGNQLFKNGQFGDALEKYSQAIAGCIDTGIDSPEDLSILYSNRAACYLKDGNSADCIQDCTRALELQPFTLKPMLRRAMAYESLERYHKAYVDYRTVLQIDVGVQAAHDSIHRITKLLIEQDGPDWREKLPDIPLVPLSAQQHRQEEPPSAELAEARAARAAEEAAKRAEMRFSVLKEEGNNFVKKGQFQKALEKYSECVALKPEECAIYTNRALCYLKLERFAEARQDCDSALQLEPSNKKAYYRRAMAYKGLENYLACSSDLQEVLRLDPNVQEAERELQEVTALLRQTLVTNSPDKPRKNITIRETNDSDDEADPSNSKRRQEDSEASADDRVERASLLLQPTNAYEFGQALNAAHSRDDVKACAELLRCIEPETLPLFLSNKLDGETFHFITRALDEHLLQEDPGLVYQHLSHLPAADRFSVVLMLLGQNERQQITHLFDHLSAVVSREFTVNDVQDLTTKYI